MSTETQRAEFDVLPELMKLADAYAQAFNQFGSSTYNPRTASERAFLENNLRAAFAQASQAAELAALKADNATKDAAIRAMLAALEESVDLVGEDYRTDWRHGVPTRQAQLDGKRELLEAHHAAIEQGKAAAMQTKEAS
jgi:hypothetical protein